MVVIVIYFACVSRRPRQDPQFNYLPLWLISLAERDCLPQLAWWERALARALVPMQHYTMLPVNARARAPSCDCNSQSGATSFYF